MIARTLLVAALLAGASVSDAASFPCHKAQSRVEKAICADPDLSELDEHLGRYYGGARMALGAGADCLRSNQREWLSVRDRCVDDTCLKDAYLHRLSELDGLQPGATAIKHSNWALPQGPALVWVIPPALDTVAAPENPDARPMKAVGTLIDEISDGDGFVLRTAEGESYLLVMLMVVDGETVDELTNLARHSGKHRYVAVGHGVWSESGPFFEPSRCTYLYRLPDR